MIHQFPKLLLFNIMTNSNKEIKDRNEKTIDGLKMVRHWMKGRGMRKEMGNAEVLAIVDGKMMQRVG